MTITVVIPYFQRRSGVLRNALASVAAQQDCELPVHVLVVDDASPVAATEEVAAVQWPDLMVATVLMRGNGGPGAARNTGLEHVSASTRYVAFLDSDDEWSPHHLARATAALEQGFDFYFADHFQLGQKVGAFERGGRITPARHQQIARVPAGLHAYQGDLFDQVLRGNVVGTSTVVYRWQSFAQERFRVEFTTAGEDYLFWMMLARGGARVAFSSEVEAIYGRGVNVYSGSGWGTDGHLLRVHQEISYRRAVRKLFALDAPQRRHVQVELKRLRLAFLRDVVHRVAHKKGFPAGLLKRQFRGDPATLLQAPAAVMRIISRQ